MHKQLLNVTRVCIPSSCWKHNPSLHATRSKRGPNLAGIAALNRALLVFAVRSGSYYTLQGHVSHLSNLYTVVPIVHTVCHCNNNNNFIISTKLMFEGDAHLRTFTPSNECWICTHSSIPWLTPVLSFMHCTCIQLRLYSNNNSVGTLALLL